VGPSGVGKTQFCHMCSIFTTLPRDRSGLDGTVAYFDTETSFSAERYLQGVSLLTKLDLLKLRKSKIQSFLPFQRI
jgi:hypothetical protein